MSYIDGPAELPDDPPEELPEETPEEPPEDIPDELEEESIAETETAIFDGVLLFGVCDCGMDSSVFTLVCKFDFVCAVSTSPNELLNEGCLTIICRLPSNFSKRCAVTIITKLNSIISIIFLDFGRSDVQCALLSMWLLEAPLFFVFGCIRHGVLHAIANFPHFN
jgi:hypothetical protein